MRKRLGVTAKIMKNPNVESALFVVQDGYAHTLTFAEKKNVQYRFDSAYRSGQAGLQRKTLADQLIKQHRRASEQTTSRYVDTRYNVPISNICERLFLFAGFSMSSCRKGLSPPTLEEQVFLHIHCSPRNMSDVHTNIH